MQAITWQVAPENRSFVELKVGTDTTTCAVTPINDQDDVKQVVITASTPSGLQAATLHRCSPCETEAPHIQLKTPVSPLFIMANYLLIIPSICASRTSPEVTWYRCTDAQGSNAIEVAYHGSTNPYVNINSQPAISVITSWFRLRPKHVRCDLGEAITDISQSPITAQDVQVNNKVLHTDFRNVSTQNQLKVLSGFWTFSPFAPQGSNAWNYGPGKAGALNLTGLMQDRNAKMSYTPIGNRFGDMKLFMTVAPFKTAGQGFSIAHLYMDVLLNMTPQLRRVMACGLSVPRNMAMPWIAYWSNTTRARSPKSVSPSLPRAIAHFARSPLKSEATDSSLTRKRPRVTPPRTLRSQPKSIWKRRSFQSLRRFGIQYTGGSPT